MTDVMVVSTATSTREAGMQLLERAVRARLAAGGQVSGPVGTCFWHEGEFGVGEEWTVALRTTARKYDELETFLVDQHEWSNPEISGTVLARVSPAYEAWVERIVGQ